MESWDLTMWDVFEIAEQYDTPIESLQDVSALSYKIRTTQPWETVGDQLANYVAYMERYIAGEFNCATNAEA